MKTVYLAGPITGLSYGEAAQGWREFMEYASVRNGCEWRCLSPMRGKEHLTGQEELLATEGQHYISTNKAIVTRDYNDVSTCDAMVANFLGATRVSIGTCVEFGFAHAHRVPLVLVMEKDNYHNHGFLTEIAGYWVQTLEEAIHVLDNLLTVGGAPPEATMNLLSGGLVMNVGERVAARKETT